MAKVNSSTEPRKNIARFETGSVQIIESCASVYTSVWVYNESNREKTFDLGEPRRAFMPIPFPHAIGLASSKQELL